MSDYTIHPMTSHETGAEIIGLEFERSGMAAEGLLKTRLRPEAEVMV